MEMDMVLVKEIIPKLVAMTVVKVVVGCGVVVSKVVGMEGSGGVGGVGW